jgi:hypothetical protein
MRIGLFKVDECGYYKKQHEELFIYLLIKVVAQFGG